MSAIISESELRVREQKLLAQLDGQPRHGLDTVFEAMSLGLEMGESGVGTTLLKDQKMVNAVNAATRTTYPALIRDGVVRLIAPKLEAVLRDPSLEIETGDVKQLLLASALLGHLRGRTKLG